MLVPMSDAVSDLLVFPMGAASPAGVGFRIDGAHLDSPNPGLFRAGE